MKSLRVLFWLALLAVSASAQVRGLVVREVDGSPRGTGITEIVVSNTTLTINGQRAIITTGGGGGSGITVGTTTVAGGTATRLFYETAGNVVGQVSGVTSDGTNVTAGSGNLRATSPRITTGINDANGNVMLAFSPAGSATEYITIANNTATNAVSLTASSPTVAASAQAGTPLNLTASPAIAGNVNAGAAAGGSLSFTAGNAARLTSGNANGGDYLFSATTGIGTGRAGVVFVPTGTSVSNPGGIVFGTSVGTANGIGSYSSGVIIHNNGQNALYINTGQGLAIPSASGYMLTSSSSDAGGTRDTGIGRRAAGVVRIIAGSNGTGGQGSLLIADNTTGGIGTSGVGVLAIANGTAPSSRPADEFQVYAADYAAGDSRANILSESNATPVTIGNHSVLTGYQHLTKTADYTVVTADSNVFFDNAGAGAGVVFTLPTPTASPSLKYTFCRVANQTVTVDIGGSVTIRSGANVTTSGGNVTLDAVGTCLTIYSVSSTEWYASAQNGTLTFN